MKVAFYVEASTNQLVLIPENDFERAALAQLGIEGSREAHLYRGSFYEAAGGYLREGRNQDSVMIRFLPPNPVSPF